MSKGLSKRVLLRALFESPTFRSRTASVPDMEWAFDNYERVVEAVVTDSEIMGDVLEELINSRELEIRNGGLTYKGRKVDF